MKNKPIKILFVCTANLSRSIIAEFCLKDYLKRNNIDTFEVSSAGFDVTLDSDNYDESHFIQMHQMGIDTSTFKRTPLSKELINQSDLIVAMGTSHQEYIKEKYGIEVPTFNEIYKGERTSLTFDINSNVDLSTQLKEMVKYIYNAMPEFVENINLIHKNI